MSLFNTASSPLITQPTGQKTLILFLVMGLIRSINLLSCFLISLLNRRTYTYSEPQLYSQNSGGSYFDTQGSSTQVSTVVTSHGMTNNGGGGSGGMNIGLTGAQVISSSSGGYLMDNAGPHPVTQAARASPVTVSPQHRPLPLPVYLSDLSTNGFLLLLVTLL